MPTGGTSVLFKEGSGCLKVVRTVQKRFIWVLFVSVCFNVVLLRYWSIPSGVSVREQCSSQVVRNHPKGFCRGESSPRGVLLQIRVLLLVKALLETKVLLKLEVLLKVEFLLEDKLLLEVELKEVMEVIPRFLSGLTLLEINVLLKVEVRSSGFSLRDGSDGSPGRGSSGRASGVQQNQ